MVHTSRAPVVCGHFDAEKAEAEAVQLLKAYPPIRRGDSFAPVIISDEDNYDAKEVQYTLANVDHSFDASPGTLRASRLIIQDLNLRGNRRGIHPHIDTIDTHAGLFPVAPLRFIFGFSSWAPSVVVGDVDFSEAEGVARETLGDRPVYRPGWLLTYAASLTDDCIKKAIKDGNAEIIPAGEPGELLLFEEGVIHWSNAPSLGSPRPIPRLGIEHYFPVDNVPDLAA